MSFSKSIGKIGKSSKAVTAFVLAVCMLAAMLICVPLSTSAGAPLKENAKDAIFVGKANVDNVAGAFIPVDIPNSDASANLYSGTAYFKLTFACKMLSGNKPVIGVMRVRNNSETGDDKTFTEPSWCNNATDVSVSGGVCTAYFKVDFNNRFNVSDCGWRSFYITVGNAEHDSEGLSEKDNSVSFIMSDAKLVACDASHNVTDSTNRLPAFADENIDFNGVYYTRSSGCAQWDSPRSASAMKWHIDSNSALVKHIAVPDNFNTSSDYGAANFTLHAATDNLREYYTNAKYGDMYFEKLANSDDKGFGIISDDLNKKFVFIDANRQGEPDNTTADSYVPTKNKVGNIFLPLSLGQYSLNGGNTSNAKVLLKVTFKANRIEGDGPPVLGRVLPRSKDGTGSWAWGLSTINARASGYYTNYNRSDNGGGIRPQCTYNPETGDYVGWVGVELANIDHSTRWGINEVLTIGNAEHVYQTGTFDSTSFNSAFSIYNIKVDLYSANQSGNEFTPDALIAEDIAPGLTADNIDTDNEWYFDYKNGISSHDKDLLRASQGQWHIDGEKSLVSFVNMEDIRAYSRKFSLEKKGGTGTLSTFIKLDPGKTYQYIFKSKNDTDAKAAPLVELRTKSGVKKLDTSNYTSDTGGFYNTTYVFKTPSNLAADKNVRIGIDFTSDKINGTFGGFELFEIGEDGMAKSNNNLLSKIFIEEETDIVPYSETAAQGVWMKSGTLGGAGTTFDKKYRADDYYKISSTPKMLVFVGMNGASEDPAVEYVGGSGLLRQKVTIEKSTKYRLSADIKYAGTGFGGEQFGFSFATSNQLGKESAFNNFTKTEGSNRYSEIYEFTSPASLSKSSNFAINFSVPDGFVSGYLSNICLTKIDESGNPVGDNLIVNGDFAEGNNDGWTKSGTFYKYRFYEIPENFFSKDPANNIHALQYRDTGDYALLQQMVAGIKPKTKYELTYKTLVTGYDSGVPYGVVYQKLWATAEKADSSWTYLQDNEKNADLADPEVITTKKVLNEDKLKAVFGKDYDSSEIKDQSILVKKVFTTSDMLRISSDNNLSVRFYFMTATSGYISDFTLYELDKDGKRIGNNLIMDADFSCGDSEFISAMPWNYSNDGTVRNIELENGFFENHSASAKMVRSDGSAANQTYGNQLFVDPNSRYYFSGNYVKTNFEGLTPEILYRSVAADGEYVSIPFEQYFDSIKYYFETEGGFTIPDDALINSEGKADIIVRLNNRDHGKGYFCGLCLTQDDSSKNLFRDDKAELGKFIEMKYDPEIFKPFEGDEGFEDGDWAGEGKEPVKTGAVTGTVVDEEEYTVPDVTMKLTPGDKKSVTDDNGNYSFSDLKPGKYKLYLVESIGGELFCTDVTVKAGVLTTLPDIVYREGSIEETVTEDGEDEEYEEYEDDNQYTDSGDDYSDDTDDYDDGEDVVEQKYGALKGYCYDSSGKLLSGVDIYVNSKAHHAKTNEKGIFVFDQVPPGKYKVCTILENGSVHVFRTVDIEAGKGTTIRVMMPDGDAFPVWLIIAIIAGGVCLIGAAVLTVILILKRKKRKGAA